MQISNAVACTLMVVACSGGETQPQADDGAKRIACAIGEGSDFSDNCLVERDKNEDGKFLTVRHPDGGFQRFEQVADGRGLVSADGMEDAALQLVDGMLQVDVGQNRYRFPARITGGEASADISPITE